MSSSTEAEGDTLRADLAAAAERRARELEQSDRGTDAQYAQERATRQAFRRLLDPGILRPNSKETAFESIKTLLTLSENLLREPENPKFSQFKPTNNVIKKRLVDTKGALEYAVALGFRAEVQNFQPMYVFNKRKMDDLRIGNEVLKEHVERETEKQERSLRARSEEKAAKELAARNVMLAYDDDRKTKLLHDRREKERREALAAAAASAASNPPSASPPPSSPVIVLSGGHRLTDDVAIETPPPYHDDSDAENE